MMNQREIRSWVVITFLFLFFFISCKQKRSGNEVNVPQIEFSSSDTSQKQSDLFEVEQVIKLQTTDSSLIGKISMIISKPSGFYILDKEGKQIMKFSPQGDFLYAINKQGRGTGEYSSLYGITVDSGDRRLYVYDGSQQQILCYHADNGDYIRSFSFMYEAGSFSALPDDGYFVFYCDFFPNRSLEKEGCYPNLVITDSLGKVQKAFAYFDKRIDTQHMERVYEGLFTNSISDSVFYCFAQFQDVVYKASSKGGDVAYCLDYMNDNQAKNDKLLQRIIGYDHIDFKRNKEDRDREGVYELIKLNFTERFIYFAGSRRNKMFYFIYDKKREETINIATLKRDVVGNHMYLRTADRDFFYLHIRNSILKKSIKSMPEGYDSKIVSAVESLEDDANPVVIKLKMKDR